MADKVNVCWVIGGYFQRKQLIQKISGSLANVKVINVQEETSGEDVLHMIKQSDEGIFNFDIQNKIIILNSMPVFKNTKQPGRMWTKVLNDCPSNVVVIFNNINKSSSVSLFKLAKKIGKVFEYDSKISESEAIEISEHFFEQDGKKVEPEDVNYFVGRIQDDKKIDSDLVHSNLMKLSAYVGKNKAVTRDDIYAAIPNNTKFVIWDWFDLMDRRNFHSLIVQIDELKKKEKPSNIVASSLPVLRWRFKLVLLAKEQKIISKDSRKVIEELSKMQKLNKDGELRQLYSDYSIRGVLYGKPGDTPPIDVYTRGQLISILKLIDNFMIKNRYGANECQSEMMLEILFMFVCGHGDLSIIKDVRQYLIER